MRRIAPTVAVLISVTLLLPSVVFAAITARAGFGILSVQLEPSLDAPIFVDGVVRNTGALRSLELAAGTYELCFGEVTGHLAPPCRETTVTAGTETSIVGTYRPAGELSVTVEPEGLEPLVFVDGVERSQAPVHLTLAEGTSSVCFAGMSGYATPDCIDLAIVGGETATVVGRYEEQHSLATQPQDLMPEPDYVSWETAWETQDFAAILGWYETNAGLSDPSALGRVTTSMVVSTHHGQIIENRNIRFAGTDNKAIWVRHNNVVVRNNRVYSEGSRNGIWVDGGLSGVVIENNEVDGSSQNYATNRQDGNWGNIGIATRGPVESIRANEIVGARQGIQASEQTLVEYNHVHRIHQNAPGVSTSGVRSQSHAPNWLFNGATTVRRNLAEAGSSGGITIYSMLGRPAADSLFAENLVVGVGRGFGIRGGHSGDARHQMRNIRIEGNRFHGEFAYPQVRGGGTNVAVNLDRPGTTFVNNRWLGGRNDLPARCGQIRDECE